MKSNSHQPKFQEVWGTVLKQVLTPQTLNLQVDIYKFIVTLQRENVHKRLSIYKPFVNCSNGLVACSRETSASSNSFTLLAISLIHNYRDLPEKLIFVVWIQCTVFTYESKSLTRRDSTWRFELYNISMKCSIQKKNLFYLSLN